MPKVFLSAGHGGKDPGAVAFGLKEKDINLNIMLSCRDVLEKHGIEVVCSRLKDENDSVSNEVAEANASKADVAVSFHTNAAKGNGSESYYSTNDPDSKRLAELCEKYVREIGQNAHGKNPVKGGDHLYFIRKTKMTAVLCECAYIDNDVDNDIIDTIPEQKKFGVAYAKAILEYLGIKYKNPAANIKVEIGTVQLYEKNTTNAQKWVKENNSDGTISFKNVATGLYLDITSASKNAGAIVQVYTKNNSNAQKFKLDGQRIVPVINTSLSVDVYANSKDNGTKIQTWTKNTSDAQKFNLVICGNSTYQIIHVGSGKAIDVAGGIACGRNNNYSISKATTTNTNAAKPTNSSFLVKITTPVLRIRKGPGTNYGVNGHVRKGETYTITETNGNWGKLKSGAGWISISSKYVKRV